MRRAKPGDAASSDQPRPSRAKSWPEREALDDASAVMPTATGGRADRLLAVRPPVHSDRLVRFMGASMIVVAIDQVTKALGHLFAGSLLTQPIINPELALGIAGGSPPVLAMTMLLALVAFGSYVILLLIRGRIPPLCAALLVGGAVGNIIDRVLIGAVRDFIPTSWVIFNVADVALIVGAAGFFVFASARGRHSSPI